MFCLQTIYFCAIFLDLSNEATDHPMMDLKLSAVQWQSILAFILLLTVLNATAQELNFNKRNVVIFLTKPDVDLTDDAISFLKFPVNGKVEVNILLIYAEYIHIPYWKLNKLFVDVPYIFYRKVCIFLKKCNLS